MRELWNVRGVVRTEKFLEWRCNLGKTPNRSKVDSRLIHLELGYIGSFKNYSKDFFHLNFYKSELRIYFGRANFSLYLLLGVESEQRWDNTMAKALDYWTHYRRSI